MMGLAGARRWSYVMLLLASVALLMLTKSQVEAKPSRGQHRRGNYHSSPSNFEQGASSSSDADDAIPSPYSASSYDSLGIQPSPHSKIRSIGQQGCRHPLRHLFSSFILTALTICQY